MSIAGALPPWLLSIVAVATVFTIMLDVGLAVDPAEVRWVGRNPALMLRGLFSVLVAVPALALCIVRGLDLPRHAQVGIIVMAIAPGAPIASRNSLGAGGHRSFAPALQISVVLLAVISLPLSVALLDQVYAAEASVAPLQLARQVFVAQLMPLGLGMLLRRLLPALAARLAPPLARAGNGLLLLLVVLALIHVHDTVIGAGIRVALAIVLVTVSALAVGHMLGGPDPATRTATAISSAARNPGLALLAATPNGAAPAISATIISYLVIAATVILPYVVWQRRARRLRFASAPTRGDSGDS